MNEFSFNLGGIQQATSNHQAQLKPWNIYEVQFDGCRVDHIKGVKDPDKTYDILKVRFSNDAGYYEESIFFPKDDDNVRPTYTSKDGHEYQGPSNFERTMMFIAQLGTVLNPEGYEKMKELSKKFKSFDDVCKVLIKITDPKKGTKTHLKLIGKTNKNGSITPALPRFCAVNKDGVVFPSDNFIGDKLFFTPYEEGKKSEYENAKPSNVSQTVDIFTDNTTMGSEDTDGIDLDILLD